MDAIQLLTDQHRMLEERLAAARAAAEPRERAALAAEAGDQLAVHVAAEEQVFYPAVRPGAPQEVLVLLDDHAALKRLLGELVGRSSDDPSNAEALAALQAETERHHTDEESHLFVWIVRAFDAERRESLGRDILAFQKGLLRAGQPRCATEELTPKTAALATV